MIVKIKTHKRPKFDYLLRYMLEGKDRLLDAGGKPFVITHNMKGKSIDGWVKQFKKNEQCRTRKRRKDGIVLYHEILSWAPADSKSLTPAKIESMIREYFRQRNRNAGFVACVHVDRGHIHAHICTSAIDRTGKNMRLSRKELADLKKNIQQYQTEKFPELSHSVVRHGRKGKRVSEKEQQFKRRTGKMSQREMVQEIVEKCHRKSKSPEDFYARLKEQKLETYVRGGKVYGVVFERRRYRFKTLGIEVEKISPKVHDRKRELQKIRAKENTKAFHLGK